MNTSRIALAMGLLAIATWGQGHAQDAAGGCPMLPASTGLSWEYSQAGDADFCRALRADGSEAFGMYIAAKPAFEPKRGDREEESRIDGHEIHWYRTELAGKPDIVARETLVKAGPDRMAHIWIQAEDEQRLQQAIGAAEQLQFNPSQLSSN
ncbi:hypothetical protein H4F99_02530 [Lysobacter sp. SG-8]|uniref:Uncharacterized protein n=1 Tax=Marilutibacter penaei TaxID=2759900 RepID=A0A7W3YDS7_9GAMM|nr:hypothetical protein [Lysobacter penaei]MBB1087362.1 hypothetical protein [Lysobacter penaei]